MKLIKLTILFFAGAFIITNAAGQANASLSVLTQNSGLVTNGGTVFLEVTLSNTGPLSSIGAYKIKLQVAAPGAIVSVSSFASVLPSGWTIINNNGSTMNLSNGTDIIDVNDSRTILIAMDGTAIGGPSTVSGQLSFSNGNAPGTAPGSLSGNSTADDNSTSTVEVITGTTPVTLLNFNASLISCQPVLNWTTETELNSDRFEIERKNQNSSNWASVGVVAAFGNAAKTKYTFTDNNLAASAGKMLYRLKVIDKDGGYKYSDILPLLANCNTFQLFVSPNPAQQGRLNVSIAGSNGAAVATLVSISGQVILKTNLKNGTNSLDVSKIASGEYVLNVSNGDVINKKIKILIQN